MRPTSVWWKATETLPVGPHTHTRSDTSQDMQSLLPSMCACVCVLHIIAAHCPSWHLQYVSPGQDTKTNTSPSTTFMGLGSGHRPHRPSDIVHRPSPIHHLKSSIRPSNHPTSDGQHFRRLLSAWPTGTTTVIQKEPAGKMKPSNFTCRSKRCWKQLALEKCIQHWAKNKRFHQSRYYMKG